MGRCGATKTSRCCGNASEIDAADNLEKLRFQGNLLIGVQLYLGYYQSTAMCVDGISFAIPTLRPITIQSTPPPNSLTV